MLRIEEVARQLRGERHGDSWMCSCPLPGHKSGDRKRSLSVKLGDRGGILMHCHVHTDATIEDFARAMGLEVRDFMPDGDAPQPERKAAKPYRPFEVGDRDRRGFETTAVYAYEDADGHVRMRKARKQKALPDGGYEKTFLMQAEKDGKWWKPSDIGSDAVDLPYHLPEVLRQAAAGGLVILAEGEKDVDNLRALGYVATCSATGGGVGKLEGKWKDAHTEALDGADVLLIPDNDEAGENYMDWIGGKLRERGKVRRVRILWLREDMPELPEKGDFTDWALILKRQGLGKTELLERFGRAIELAPEWDPNGLRVFTAAQPTDGTSSAGRRNGPPAQAAGTSGDGDDFPAYHGSAKYCIVNGCLAKRTQNGPRVLCSFVPEPRELIRYDDGLTVRQKFLMGGTAADGRELPDKVVESTRDMMGPSWSVEAWGWDGAMSASRGTPGEIFEAVSAAGRRERKCRTVYGHTGMRTIDGEPCFLYHGGAIGRDGVSVELGGPLVRIALPEEINPESGEKWTPLEAAMAERILIDAYPARVILPLLAQAYLAPVYSELEAMQAPPAYAVLLDGQTNAGKSTTAGYVASHFGAFYSKAMPASFSDSQAGMRDKMFAAKDALLVADDYRRQQGDGGRRSSQDMLADMIISAIGDRVGRSRENADRTMERERPARCTMIMTGEVLPNISVSRRTRIYRITVDFGELIVPADVYDVLQAFQRGGAFRACMRGYILGLLSRWDGIRRELTERLREATEEARRTASRAEGRFRETTAHLLMGSGLMLDHLIACGAATEEDRRRLLAQLSAEIAWNLRKQGQETDDARPEQRWLDAVRALVGSGSLRLYDKAKPEQGQPVMELHGFYNGDVLELIAPRIEAEVGEMLRKGQRTLETADYSDIYRALAARKMIAFKPAADGSIGRTRLNTKWKGQQFSCIKLFRWALAGDTEEEAKRSAQEFEPTGEDAPGEWMEE